MSLSSKLNTKQSQRLVLTQQLVQSIELLQLSNLELLERINAELVENPVLEEWDRERHSTNENEKDGELISDVNKELSGDESIYDRREARDMIYEDNIHSRKSDDDKKRRFIENAVTQEETLKEHLSTQARLIAKDAAELNLFENIITSIDDNGFLVAALNQIAEDCNIDIAEVQRITSIVNSLDPIGCGVYDIQEALIVQAQELYSDDKTLIKILTDCYKDFERLDYDKISETLHITQSEVIQKSRLIHYLDPFPGRKYSDNKKIKYIIPDIEIKLIDDEIIVNLNDEWIPEIRINKYYKDILQKKYIDKNLQEYLKNKIQSAKYLLRSISNRRETIVRVVTAIMESQQEFITHRTGHLKPLVYSDIAQITGLHESTVSRVVNNKFVQTHWGVFELKYFFVTKLKSLNDGAFSSNEVMNIIKNLVENEDKDHPISDTEINKRLEEMNIRVARRTIAKYRSLLQIPSSSIRKKINKIKNEEII